MPTNIIRHFIGHNELILDVIVTVLVPIKMVFVGNNEPAIEGQCKLYNPNQSNKQVIVEER